MAGELHRDGGTLDTEYLGRAGIVIRSDDPDSWARAFHQLEIAEAALLECVRTRSRQRFPERPASMVPRGWVWPWETK